MPAAMWSAWSVAATSCAGPPAACPRSVVRPEGFRQAARVAFLDHFDQARAEIVPAKQRPAGAAAQVQDATRHFWSPRRWCATVGGRARAVQLLGRRLVASAARTSTRVDHAGRQGSPPDHVFQSGLLGPPTLAL